MNEYAVVPTGIVCDAKFVYVAPSVELAKVNDVTFDAIFVTNNVVEDVTLKVRDIYYTVPSSF